MTTATNTIRFSGLFADVAIKADREKIRHNTADDHGLGPAYVWIGGRWPDTAPGQRLAAGSWLNCYGRLSDEHRDRLARRMCEGPVVSCKLIRRDDGTVHAWASDRTGIPSVDVGPVVEIPDHVAPFVR
jgi:hypothetical protein